MLPFRGVRPKLSVALRGGYFSNFDRVAGPTAAVALDYHLPFAGGERFAVGVDLGLSMSTTNETMPESLTIETRSLPMLARASVWHPVKMVWLYAGANFGPVVSELAVESASTGRIVTTEWTLALGAFAGADVGLGPGRLIFEAGYTRANVDSSMVEGNVLGLQISAGYRLGLF